jgi:hypothetical protein
LVKLVVRVGKDNAALKGQDRAFIREIETILHGNNVAFTEPQMATIRRLADEVVIPETNLVWIARLNRFTFELQDRGVDGCKIGDSMIASWPEWDDVWQGDGPARTKIGFVGGLLWPRLGRSAYKAYQSLTSVIARQTRSN